MYDLFVHAVGFVLTIVGVIGLTPVLFSRDGALVVLAVVVSPAAMFCFGAGLGLLMPSIVFGHTIGTVLIISGIVSVAPLRLMIDDGFDGWRAWAAAVISGTLLLSGFGINTFF